MDEDSFREDVKTIFNLKDTKQFKYQLSILIRKVISKIIYV